MFRHYQRVLDMSPLIVFHVAIRGAGAPLLWSRRRWMLVPHKHIEYDEWPGNGPQVVMRYRYWDWCGRRWFERTRIESPNARP